MEPDTPAIPDLHVQPPEKEGAAEIARLLDALTDPDSFSGDEVPHDRSIERLILSAPHASLRQALRTRLDDLDVPEGGELLRLVEAVADPELLELLATSLRNQPGLTPERAWQAMTLLDDAGLIDQYPDLLERWDDLNASIDEGDVSLAELADQIEHDPEGLWLALQGLAAVEPEVRAEIIAGLADLEAGPNLIAFLRLLVYSHEPGSRATALDALAGREGGPDPHHLDRAAAWNTIAADHPDPDVVTRARSWLNRHGTPPSMTPASLSNALAMAWPRAELVGRETEGPRILGTLVTAIDGRGQATIAISAWDGTTRSSAAFLCDIERGVRDVFGQTYRPESSGDVVPSADDDFLDDLAASPGGVGQDSAGSELASANVRDTPALAIALLQGCLLLCGAETSPALRYWIEATIGPGLVPRPFPIAFPDWDPTSVRADETAAHAQAILDACPSWVDQSRLTFDLAEELFLREGELQPDPQRDAGAYRYLFEHRLRDRLEIYRRMLLWMSLFWQAAGQPELGRSALALATQLGDEQHAVPGHPFNVALSTRSLIAAGGGSRRDCGEASAEGFP